MNKTEQKRQELAIVLGMLGETAKEVAGNLHRLGIKGDPNSACRCPIAEYLKSCGFCDPAISTGVQLGLGPYFDWASLSRAIGRKTPPFLHACREFICVFDYGDFRSLRRVQ